MGVSFIDWYDRSGGVGVLVLRRLKLRCLDFRDKIEPAHDFTFFCFFFLLGFLDIDDLREEGCSIEVMGASGVISSVVGAGAGAGAACLGSLDEATLDGRDRFGEESPELPSCPKKPHFRVGNLGLVGVVGIPSFNNGLELLRRGLGRLSGVGEFSRVPSNLGPALFGRASMPLSLEARCSLDSGDEVPPDTIDVRLPETECPRIVAIEEPSLETRDNGRGMISTLSENPTRARFSWFKFRFSGLVALLVSVDGWSSLLDSKKLAKGG